VPAADRRDAAQPGGGARQRRQCAHLRPGWGADARPVSLLPLHAARHRLAGDGAEPAGRAADGRARRPRVRHDLGGRRRAWRGGAEAHLSALRAHWRGGWTPGVLFLVAAALPLVLTGSFQQNVMALMAAYAISALGLNLLVGVAGQISLGHGAFMSIGGYTAA